MALSYVNSASNKSATTSVLITKPTNVADGDIMIAFVSAFRATNQTAGVVTAPAGWNTINTQAISTRYQVGLFWKRASSEGASYSFTSASATRMQGAISAYSGAVASGNPYTVLSNTLYGTSGTIVRAATMTPSATGMYTVWGGWFYLSSATALTKPTAMTLLQTQANTTNVLTMAHATFTPGVATGNQDGTASGTCTVKHAYMVEVLAAPDTDTQTATARIQQVGVTDTQTATAKIVLAGLKTQTATARIQITGVTKTQTATAKIVLAGSSTQTATARIQKVGATKTQIATACIFVPLPTVALNTPTDTATISDMTPVLAFTGTSPRALDLEYNLQIDTTNSFSSQFLTAATLTKTLGSYENNAYSITSDANYVYVGIWTNPAKVVRINKSDFTTTVTKTLASGEDFTTAITNDTNYVYVGTYTTPAKVVRINKSDFTTTVTKTLATGENNTYVITNDTNYVYVGTYTTPAKVVRINKSDFTTTVTKTLATGENNAYVMTNDMNYVYVGTYTVPAKVIRINKSDFTTTVTKTLATGEDNAYAITNDTDYVYVSTNTAPAKVIRINKSDFTTTVTKTLATGEDAATAITNDTNYVYVGTYTTPAKVIRINKSDFTTTVTKTMATGENHAYAITIDTNYVYVSISPIPGKVVRINIGALFPNIQILTPVLSMLPTAVIPIHLPLMMKLVTPFNQPTF